MSHTRLLGLFIVALAFWKTVTALVVAPFVIPTPSMAPALVPGDQVFVNKTVFLRHLGPLSIHWPWSRRPVRFDIIAFDAPPEPGTAFVKRVIGLPGDTVEVFEGTLYINGHVTREPYANPTPPTPDIASEMAVSLRWQVPYLLHPGPYTPTWDQWGPIVVPAHHYLVLGDNRPNSGDSRFWGFVPEQNLIGIPSFIYFSSVSNPWRIVWPRLASIPR